MTNTHFTTKIKIMSEDTPPAVDNSDPDDIRLNTSKQLFDIVSATFKEQTDLDESVWRAMPFIAALFGIAITVFRFVEPHFSFNTTIAAFAAGLLYLLSIAAFVFAFVFFWAAVKPREFEYPSAGKKIHNHAKALTAWHRAANTPEKKIDDEVTNDLRIFMINQLSDVNETNLIVVSKRLSARSRTILLMLAGFAFVMASEMIIFIEKQI